MKYKKIFITGCTRSGTSRVHLILKRHPSVITPGNASWLYKLLIAPIKELGLRKGRNLEFVLDIFKKVNYNYKKCNPDLDQWEDAASQLINWVSYGEFQKIVRIALKKKNLSDIKRAELVINLVFDNFFKENNNNKKDILVDKCPSNMDYVKMILDRYAEAKTIEVIRDGRDVCLSMEKRFKKKKFFPSKRKEQILFWKKTVEQGMKLRANKLYSNRILLSRYEEFELNPKKEIKKIYQFAGIKESSKLIDNIILYHIDIKNDGKIGQGHHFWKGVSGGWKKYFSKEDISLFKKTANNTLKKLGYKW